MDSPLLRKSIRIAGGLLLLWLALRYLYPLLRPFLLAGLLALAAEPLVQFFHRQLHLRRGFATGIGVSVCICLISLLVLALGAFLLREVRQLAFVLPDMESTAQQGLSVLQHWVQDLAASAPGSIQNMLQDAVDHLFSGSSALLDTFTGWLLSLASGLLSHLPDGAVGIATALIASYMISAKLPGIRTWLSSRIPPVWKERYLPALLGIKDTLWGWLRAQLKLTAITFTLLTLGFVLLQIPYAPAWAAAVALVDAIPILGTGTVLVPWGIVSLLQGKHIRALGLLCLWGTVSLTRSILEPKLVGKQLGLDPLVTLVALYIGFYQWGIWGMLLAPMAAVFLLRIADFRT